MRVLSHWLKVSGLRGDAVMARLFKNAGILLSGSAVASLLTLATLSVTAQALGTAQFGLLVVITTYVLIVDGLLNFQSWQTLIRYGADALEDHQSGRFKAIIRFCFILDTSSALVGMVVAILMAPLVGNILGWSDHKIQLAILYSMIIVFNVSGAPTGILRLFNRFNLLATQRIIGASFKVTGVIVVSLLDGGLRDFLFVWGLTSILDNVLLLGFGLRELAKRHYADWWHERVENWRELLRFSTWTNITSTFDLPVKQFDMILVSALISVEATGIYRIIKQAAQMIAKFADPVYQVVYPQFAVQIANSDYRQAASHAIRIGILLFAVVAPVALVVSLSASWWLEAFFGEDFLQGLSALRLFFFLKFASIGFITIHPLFVAMGFVKANAIIILSTNLIYLVLVGLLGEVYGLDGVVIANGVQFFLVIGLKLMILSKHNYSDVIRITR